MRIKNTSYNSYRACQKVASQRILLYIKFYALVQLIANLESFIALYAD